MSISKSDPTDPDPTDPNNNLNNLIETNATATRDYDHKEAI